MAKQPGKEDHAQYVYNTFNSIAARYDRFNTLITLGRDKNWRQLAVRRSGLGAGGRGLDICCGTGLLTMELARAAGPTGKIVGLDFADNMLAMARRNAAGFPWKETISFIRGDAMALPFTPHSFDCVTAAWGLRHLFDLSAAIKEAVRVVKPGGKIVSLDMAQPTLPVFRQVYWFCFARLIPLAGKLVTGNKEAYDYLYDSSRSFIKPEELAAFFNAAGLTEVRSINLGGGIAAIVEGRKPF